MEETASMDWIGRWPIIDEDGVIQGLVEADDDVATELSPVDWKDGKAVPTGYDHGFDAFLAS